MKLFSRRNDVILHDKRVTKHFAQEGSFRRELDTVIFLKSAKIPVPRVLSAKNNTIEYEYIEGRTYQSIVDCFEEKHADALLTWLESYYIAAGKLRGDVNLRNFIYCETKDICVGVDFEDEADIGDRESDYGRIIAFAAAYDPPFSKEKETCARLLLDCFSRAGADKSKMFGAYQAEMLDIIHRRPGRHYEMKEAFLFWENIAL